MDDKNKDLFSWVFILVVILMVTTVTVLSLPDFSSVKKVKYTTSNSTTSTGFEDAGTKTGTTAATSSVVTSQSETVFPINLNTATAEQLMQVPGIGETYAKRIIEFREEITAFTSYEELLLIKGIGEKRLKKWLPYLTL